MNKPAVIAITDAIPSETLQSRLGVSKHAIRHARTTGAFSGRWYGPLMQLCDEAGIECPLDAFVWAEGAEAAE